MSISLWLAAPLIGIVLSLFAAGGGMIAVPLLHYGMGLPLKQAIVTSLIIVACVSMIALGQKKRWQLIEWRLHRFFATGGVIGGFLGATIGLNISDHIQSMIFAALVLFVAWWMHSDVMKNITATSRTTPCDCRYSLMAGVATGLVTGLLGVGGGFLIVPLLLMLGVSNYQSAIAHSLMLITSSSLVAALRYAEDLDIAWEPMFWVVMLAVLGAWLGTAIAARYQAGFLQKSFSWALILMAFAILGKIFYGV
ncbi:MAG: sulfite exporter TauE/SafE family protein [Mariprofundaceae bacterium]